MDLEALPPEDPTPAGGEHPEAPRPAWEPAPWQPTWGTDPTAAPAWTPDGDEAPPPKRLGFSRTTKVVSGAVAIALVAGGAWAAGTALHGGGGTVRFQPAAATSTAASGGGTGGSTGGSATNPHPRYQMRGGSGTIGSVNTGAGSFTVNATVPPPKPTTPGAAPATPPAAPTTKSVTVKTTAQTTFISVTQGSPSGLSTGMEVVAVGTVTNGTLTATDVGGAQPGVLPSRPKPPASATPNVPKPPSGVAPPALPAGHRGITTGTIASITKDQPAAGDVTLHLTTNSNRGATTVVVTSTTTIALAEKGSINTLKAGDLAVVRGTHNADGSVTASTVITVSAGLKNAAGGIGRGFVFGPLGGLGPWMRLGGPGGFPGFPGFPGGPGGFGRFGFGHRGADPANGSGVAPGSGSSGSSGSSGTNGSTGTKSGSGPI
jgi:collagen type VII alpha